MSGPFTPGHSSPVPAHGDDRRSTQASNGPDSYAMISDPANLLNVYPFMTYAPTARVAQHLSPHTRTYIPSASSTELYPQHAQTFASIDRPTSAEDWVVRQAAEARLREVLSRGVSYVQQSHPGPSHGGGLLHPPLPSSQQQGNQPLSLPYTFLPGYMAATAAATSDASSSRQHFPPTPSSSNGATPSPQLVPDSRQYMENIVSATLAKAEAQERALAAKQESTAGSGNQTKPTSRRRSRSGSRPTPPPRSSSSSAAHVVPTSVTESGRERGTSPRRVSMTARRSPHPPSSVASTPTHERIMASSPVSSPDVLGPSPTKRQRGNFRSASPSFASGKQVPGQADMRLSHLSMRDNSSAQDETPKAKKAYKKVLEVEIPSKRAKAAGAIVIDGDDDEEEDDGLDWGGDRDGDWDMDGSYGESSKGAQTIHRSGRTGERDQRNTWQKLQSSLEDIFEEADAFPANPSAGDLAGSRFFATTSVDGSSPLLAFDTIRKVSQYVARVQRTKRRHTQAVVSDNEAKEWDPEVMTRLLRLLERSMRDSENVTVFPDDRKVAAAVQEGEIADKTKKKKGRPAKKDKSLEQSKPILSTASEMNVDSLQHHESLVARARDGVAAAECCLTLLNTEGLSKQMYSEDLLSASVSIIKDQMEKVILPIIGAMAGDKVSSTYLAYILALEISATTQRSKVLPAGSPHFAHPSLSSLAQSICSALPRLAALIAKPSLALSDSLVIQTVYLAIGPMFVSEPTMKKSKVKEIAGSPGSSMMKALKLEALGCLRGTFARYEEQRHWIVEEILSSLIRVPGQNHAQNLFQLGNGKSIHTISALLLQLIQASAYGTAARVRKLHSTAADMDIVDPQAPKVDVTEEEDRICADTMESALRSARVVAGSSSTKASKTSHDSDYKAILELFLTDLMAVAYRPEWPAAALYLSVFSRIMITAVEDQKMGPEATAAKGIALDYLGDIAAKLKSLQMEMGGDNEVATMDEVISNVDVSGFSRLVQSHTAIRTFLSAACREDASIASARDMALVIWAQELQGAIKKSASVIIKLQEENTADAQETVGRLQTITMSMKHALHAVWMGEDGLFEVGQNEIATQSSIAVSRGRPLQNAIIPILHALLSVMDNPAVGLRSKALRGISAVTMVDPEVLSLPHIHQALEHRLADSSPAVRDAAVELVGKYIVQRPKLAAEYYPHIAQRTMDSGLGVRKRVIKLLRSIFGTMEMNEMKIDICCRMILLTNDQDEGVQELAVKTLAEMLYPARGGDTASLLVDILGEYRGSNAVLERALIEIAKENEQSGNSGRFGQTIDALIGRLIDATERADFDSLGHIRAIWLLCASDASQIDTHKAGVLLSYLRPPANVDDQATNELLLRIFKTCIPFMPRTASSFASDLTKALMPMISKPAGGFQALREIIGCFCAVTVNLTKDWIRLITVLRACEAKIRPIRNQFTSTGHTSSSSQAASMMLYITALIAEGCKLDQIALEESDVDLELRKITSEPISSYLYEVYLDFAQIPSYQNAAIICLGSLFRTYPAMLQRPETTSWMRTTFASNNADNHAQLLGVIHEFLASEAQKRAAGEKAKKDVNLLIGSAKELQDSDFSTTIVQNNIEQIFSCARSQHSPTQNAALDILTFVVNQGLYSPVHTVPILVTLETAEDQEIAERALTLHSALHVKHASLVTVLYLESAKASYLYQKTITAEPSGHRNGDALLSSWYTLLSEKRVWRHDFLKALCRTFDSDASDAEPGFVLYLAENLATLDYKLQEEPMTVVWCLSKIISTCTPLVAMLEDGQIQGNEGDPIQGKLVSVGNAGGTTIEVEKLVDASVIVGLSVMLKNHLVALYHLPEDKCASHVPGKKSAIGDKPAVRRGSAVLDLSRMPLVRGVQTVDDFKNQQAAFLHLVHEDGTLTDEA
ncbi:hypothetical protein IAU60_000086 [Kwoniella sp. DSM 27419]